MSNLLLGVVFDGPLQDKRRIHVLSMLFVFICVCRCSISI